MTSTNAAEQWHSFTVIEAPDSQPQTYPCTLLLVGFAQLKIFLQPLAAFGGAKLSVWGGLAPPSPPLSTPLPPSLQYLRRRFSASSAFCKPSPAYCTLAVVSTHGRGAFSIAGPTVWNSLPDELRDPACGSDSFKQFLKTILFSLY